MKRYAPLLSPQVLAATISSVPRGAESFVLSELANATTPRTLVYVAMDDREADAIASHLAIIQPDLPVLNYPAWDCLPYDRTSPNSTIVAERVVTLAALTHAPKHQLVLTTVNAILQRTAPREQMKHAAFALKKGMNLPRERL